MKQNKKEKMDIQNMKQKKRNRGICGGILYDRRVDQRNGRADRFS